ncbi:phage tail tape measure protein [Clostridium celatum]|uniref:phage tail protein n=1 Tax=Clostridium celatum TaxID=36834 RepID=UPI001F18B975|nr:phage tail tape measure protein [Clostridium celatum]MCE9656508.1 phage tail tape measure protein [Clostridium celatum]
MSDGKIIIDTEIDNSGLEKGIKNFDGKLGSIASSAVKTFAKVSAAMTTAAVGAIGVLTKLSVEQYAEYEQLVGGVETLFKKSSNKVMEYANNAYQSAGMSANEYMNTITGFAASLLQGLGGDTEKAAQIGNMAVEDMADNANKMGTSIEMIQNAYQGFAKQNYTMLDNLKLGFGGTKEEMQRLLQEAEKISGIKYDISNFNDIIEAIHVIQTEMGITGTTAKEAASTIEGSLNMTKSAWTNLLTGMADDNANFDVLVENLVNSLGSLGENLLPRIKIAIEGVGELIRELLPKVLDKAPEMMASLFPESMREDVKKIFDGIAEAIKTTADVAMQWIPKITEGFAWILENGNNIAAVVLGIGTAMLTLNIANMILGVVKAFKGVTTAAQAWKVAQDLLNLSILANPIGLIVAAIAGLVAGVIYLWNTNDGFKNACINAWNKIKEVGEKCWNAICDFFTKTIPDAWNSLISWFQGIPDWFGELWTKVTDKFKEWGENIKSFFTETIPTLIQQVFDWFNELPYKIGYALGYALGSIIQWGVDTWNYLITNVPIWIENVVNFFAQLPGKIWRWLVETFNKVTTWGSNMLNKAKEIGTNFINNIINWVEKLPGKFSSWLNDTISKVVSFASDLGQRASQAGKNMVDNIINAVKNLPSQMASIGKNIVEGVWNGITGMGSWLIDKVSSFFSGIVDGAKKALGIHSPSRVMRDQVGKYMAQGVGVGFENESDNLEKSMNKNLNDIVAKMQATVSMERLRAVPTGVTSINNTSHSNITNNDNGVTQNITFNNLVKTPSEVARQIRKVGRELAFG